MNSIRKLAFLGLALGMVVGMPAQADDEEAQALTIQYELIGVGADDAAPYAAWLLREDDSIGSAELVDGIATVTVKPGEEITLQEIFDMTESYAADRQKDGIDVDVGSFVLSSPVLVRFENVDTDTAHFDLVRKLDDMDDMKAWIEEGAENGEFWIQPEGEQTIDLRTFLEQIGVEPKLMTQYEREGKDVDEVALEDVTWQAPAID